MDSKKRREDVLLVTNPMYIKESANKESSYPAEKLLLSNIYPSVKEVKTKRPGIVFPEYPPTSWKQKEQRYEVPTSNLNSSLFL